MKEKKGFIIAIIALVVIVAGLVTYIVIDKSKGKEKAEEVTTQATTEAVEDKATSDDADKSTTEKKDATKETKDEKKLACYATIKADNNWQEGNKVVYQFSGK